MLLPVTVYTESLIYDFMESKTVKILNIFFKGNLPNIRMLRDEFINMYEIKRVLFDKSTGFTELRLIDGTVLIVTNPLEDVVALMSDYEEGNFSNGRAEDAEEMEN